MLCIISHQVTRLLQCLGASSQSFLSGTDNLTQRSSSRTQWQEFHGLKSFVSLIRSSPPSYQSHKAMAANNITCHESISSFFLFSRWWKKKLTGRSFQARWLYCGQGAVLELQSCNLHWFLTSQAGLSCHCHGGRNTDGELANYCLQQSKIMAQSWLAKLQAVEKADLWKCILAVPSRV